MEKLLSWLSLRSVPGIGNHLFKRLIDRFTSPEKVFHASPDDLLEVEGISQRLVAAIQKYSVPDSVRKEMDLVVEKGYQIVTMTDPNYPPLLLQIPDPPPFLYVYGQLGHTAKSIAVVGSRVATRYGLTTTDSLCRNMAKLNITVVSGMARGIDTAAHEGALQGKGVTIAVLGSGLERVYPYENLRLFHRIAESGAVISEFPLTADPEAHHFPIRNRIISGITLGTVVVEAARKSGSLITARLAGEQGREVFAVPGSIRSFKSTGTHKLIQEGAKLLTNVQDIVEELPQIIRTHLATEAIDQTQMLDKVPPLTPEETEVFKALGPYPMHIDDLGRKLSADPGKLSSILLQLELKGVVQQDPGMLFSIQVESML